MKILKGEFKNRSIIVPGKTRPVALRVKRSLFDILQDVIPESHVLDLFAGSGALGIESVSQGAHHAVFVDSGLSPVKTIRQNVNSLKIAHKTKVICKDALAVVKRFHERGDHFDIIYADPPYYQGLTRKTLHTLEAYDILTPRGFVVVTCFYKDIFDSQFTHFQEISRRSYGQTVIIVYQNRDEKSHISRDI
ncbi:MAG: 16S rRNA (guanine(966)-N(2))-methyltransferase RsmD [Candidatus Omnitrophica bacterium]|nr:16S rRNA (guanine(966)-N(2))-methyltransferase RsmD [Candidatus Omnitrophota bacterium]